MVDIGSGMKTVRPADRKKKGNNAAEDNNKWIPHTAEKVYKFNASLNKWEKVAPVYLYSNGWINISQE